jgi:8-oxo-dGTP diphosphatase
MEKYPRVGIGVYIMKGGLVLMGKRIGLHGRNTWSAPGGSLEFGESWEDCAMREALEEAGVNIKNLRFGAVTNDISNEEQQHFVTIHMVANLESGEPQLMEPDKWERWDWFSWDELPQPLFYPYKILLEQKFDPRKI